MLNQTSFQLFIWLHLLLTAPLAFADLRENTTENVSALLQERGGAKAYSRLQQLSDHHSPRINGSTELEDALDWARDLMAKDGLSNLQKQPVQVPHWIRGKASAAILEPVSRTLDILALGGSPATPETGIEGEVIVFQTLDALRLASREQVAGKIVLLNERMFTLGNHSAEQRYQRAVAARIKGPALASTLGAKAALVRSITTQSLGTLHTGMTRFDSTNASPIPSASVTIEEAERLVRLTQEGPVKVHINLQAEWLKDAISHNVIGEIKGSTYPDEIILVGAHMDTWDIGDGSMDNGCGCVMALEAVRLLNRLPFKPKRTIRIVLFTDEEHMQRGAEAYFKRFGHDHHVSAVETDLGCGAPQGYTVDGKREDLEFLRSHLPSFSRFGVQEVQWGGSGANIAPLVEGKGIVGIGVKPNMKTYFDRHHSAADTFEKISADYLDQHSRGLALLLHLLSERDAQ